MFRKKIIWLALFSLLPVAAIAGEAQVLVDRAHYWNKLGRADLAQLAWEELLVVEPGNAEAQAGLARVQVQNIPAENTQPEVVAQPLVIKASADAPRVSDWVAGRNYLDHPSLGLVKEQPDLAGPGGALVTSDNPSRTELLARAKYWDGRGRADLAAKVRNQYKLSEDKQEAQLPVMTDKPSSAIAKRESETTVVASEVQVNPPPPTRPPEPELLVAAAPVKPSTPGEQAQYWQARGRSDLAEKIAPSVDVKPARVSEAATAESVSSAMPKAFDIVQPTAQDKARQAQYWQARGRSDLVETTRNPVAEAAVTVAPSTPVRSASIMSISGAVADSRVVEVPVLPPSRQELSDGAQYWEMHGRNDLADQLRQKLQTMEPASSRAAYPVRGAVSGRYPVQDKNIDNNQYIAKSSLEDELLKNPNSLKARLDLAQIYRSAGEMAKARVLIDGVLVSQPDLPEALYASAALFAEQRLWPETLHVLEKISPVSRNAEMAKLQKMAWAHVQIDRADALVRQGNNLEAELLLRQVAAALAVHANQRSLPEPPPLWKSADAPRRKQKH